MSVITNMISYYFVYKLFIGPGETFLRSYEPYIAQHDEFIISTGLEWKTVDLVPWVSYGKFVWYPFLRGGQLEALLVEPEGVTSSKLSITKQAQSL